MAEFAGQGEDPEKNTSRKSKTDGLNKLTASSNKKDNDEKSSISSNAKAKAKDLKDNGVETKITMLFTLENGPQKQVAQDIAKKVPAIVFLSITIPRCSKQKH